jgi:hypothetical protein
MEVSNASKTELLMAVSVGRWFMILLAGCKMSQACCSLASLITYATNCAWVAVTGGRSDEDRLHDGVVGRVSDWSLRKNFD